MSTERMIRIVAGAFVMVSVIMAAAVNGIALMHPTWLWFTLFVGVNLFQSGVTRWCLMETILRRLGMRSDADIVKCETSKLL